MGVLMQKQVLWQSALLVFGPNVLNKTLPGTSISVVAAPHRGLELQPGPPRGAGAALNSRAQRSGVPPLGGGGLHAGCLSLRPGCDSVRIWLSLNL